MDEADYFPGVDFSEYDVQGLAAYMKRATNLPGHREAQESKIKCSFKEYNKSVKPRGAVFTDTEVKGILHDLTLEETKTFTGDVFYMLLFPDNKFYTDEQLERVMRTNVAKRIRKTFKIERLREKQERKRAKEALANTASDVQMRVGIQEDLDVDLRAKEQQKSFDDWWAEMRESTTDVSSITTLEKIFFKAFHELCKLEDINSDHIQQFMEFYVGTCVANINQQAREATKTIRDNDFNPILDKICEKLDLPMPFESIHDIWVGILSKGLAGNKKSLSPIQLAQLTRDLLDAVNKLTNAVPEKAIRKPKRPLLTGSNEDQWWQKVKDTMDTAPDNEDFLKSLNNAYMCLVYAEKNRTNIILSKFMKLYVNGWINRCKESRQDDIANLADVDFEVKMQQLRQTLCEFDGHDFVELHTSWKPHFLMDPHRKFRTPTKNQIEVLTRELAVTIFRNIMTDDSEDVQHTSKSPKDSPDEDDIHVSDSIRELYRNLKKTVNHMRFESNFVDAFASAYDSLSESKNLKDADELYPLMELYVTDWFPKMFNSSTYETISEENFDVMLRKALFKFRGNTCYSFRDIHNIWTSTFKFRINETFFRPTDEQFGRLIRELTAIAYESIMSFAEETPTKKLKSDHSKPVDVSSPVKHGSTLSWLVQDTLEHHSSKNIQLNSNKTSAGKKKKGHSNSTPVEMEKTISPTHAYSDKQPSLVSAGSDDGGAADLPNQGKTSHKSFNAEQAGADEDEEDAEQGLSMSQADFMRKYGDKIKKGKDLIEQWKIGFSAGTIRY